MCMYPLSIRAIPQQTALVARAAFPKGNPYLTLRDELGGVFEDSDFEALFATVGQQALQPWRTALVTVLQFRENQLLIDWANEQSLAATLTCLGDGHDGIWNIIAEIGHEEQRREILDWYHLMENLAKVESSQERLASVKDLLWEGKVKTVLAQFEDCSDAHAQAFVAYLRKHQHRIVNYEYYQLEGISIGSGAIESGIKQIAARVKLTGAQWEAKNIPQVLRHRCAYLNGQFSMVTPPS